MAWTVQGSIKGPTGAKGDQGVKGVTGATGAKGDKGDNISVWTGTAAQYASVDKNTYDLYLVKA